MKYKVEKEFFDTINFLVRLGYNITVMIPTESILTVELYHPVGAVVHILKCFKNKKEYDESPLLGKEMIKLSTMTGY